MSNETERKVDEPEQAAPDADGGVDADELYRADRADRLFLIAIARVIEATIAPLGANESYAEDRRLGDEAAKARDEMLLSAFREADRILTMRYHYGK